MVGVYGGVGGEDDSGVGSGTEETTASPGARGTAVSRKGGDGRVGKDAASSCQGELTAASVKTRRERAQQVANANDAGRVPLWAAEVVTSA